MPRYSEKQKAALDVLMKDDVYTQAIEIITLEGGKALTMDRLARGVGVSRGTLYNYFTDRDAVIDYIDDRAFTPLLTEVQKIGKGGLDPTEKLRAIADRIFDGIYSNRALVKALFPEKETGAGRRRKEKRHQNALALFQDVITEGIETGIFRDISPVLASEMFFGSISGLIDTMAISGEFKKPEEVVPALMEFTLAGLRKQGA